MQFFLEYHRPASLEAALRLLSRTDLVTRPLAGGTHFHRGVAQGIEAVVDLHDLGLDEIKAQEGQIWKLGAMATLEDLALTHDLQPALRLAARREAPRNLRQSATLGGLIACGESGPLLACLLAINANLALEPGSRSLPLATYLEERQSEALASTLIMAVTFEASRSLGMAEIARTPADFPLMVTAVSAKLADGRLAGVRLVTGASGQPLSLCPATARQLEGLLVDNAPQTILEDYSEAAWQDDLRASAEYRQAMCPVLVKRALADLVAM